MDKTEGCSWHSGAPAMLSASIITYFVLLMMGRLSPFCLSNSGGTEMLSDFSQSCTALWSWDLIPGESNSRTCAPSPPSVPLGLLEAMASEPGLGVMPVNWWTSSTTRSIVREGLEVRLAAWSSLGRTSLVAQMVKNLPAMQKTWVWYLDGEDPLEKGMATHSSVLAWRIPGQRNLAGYSPWGWKESEMRSQETFQLH